jgi:hypothetical protein
VNAFQYKNSYTDERNPSKTDGSVIMHEMLAYKNFAGEFVQRRMNKAMRTFDKDGLENFDDVSIATIKFGE